MTALLSCLLFWFGQLNSLQSKPVVYLRPNSTFISLGFGGKTLNLINAPSSLSLPLEAPTPDAQGNQWAIDIKNLGPAAVTVVSKRGFTVTVAVGATVHIYSDGKAYIRRW